MTRPKLYDHRNQPINYEALQEEEGAPQLGTIRNVWWPPIAPGLTLRELVGVLDEAIHGTARAYLTLAEEMEERDLHYAFVIRTRKLAVSGIDPVVVSASTDPQHEKHADLYRSVIESPEFGNVVIDLLDAIAKGYSVIETIWRRGKVWTPECFKWRDPRFFRFDWETGEELRLLDEKDPAFGIPLEPFKWIVHRPHLKTGLPIRGGFARLACVAYLCKSLTVKDWLAFADVFGMPFRLGKYSSKATPEEKRKLLHAVANLATDAAAIIPESMQIDFESAAEGAGGAPLYEGLTNFWDNQISKAGLGQTMNSKDGSSYKHAEVMSEVRKDFRDSDLRQLERTIDLCVGRPLIDLNFGRQDRYPRLKLPVEEQVDLQARTNALFPLIDRGLRVSQAEVIKPFGMSLAQDDEPVLTPAGKTPSVDPKDDEDESESSPGEE